MVGGQGMPCTLTLKREELFCICKFRLESVDFYKFAFEGAFIFLELFAVSYLCCGCWSEVLAGLSLF